MVASFDTIERIFEVMVRHCTPEQIAAIVQDLQSVPGNKSFRDTIERLALLQRTPGSGGDREHRD